MKKRKSLYLNALLSVVLVAGLVSCTGGTRKKAMLNNLSDNMHSSYTAEISYNIAAADFTLSGDAIVIKDKANITLKLLTPEQYSGLTIAYDVMGDAKSVAVHFSGIDTTLPTEAVSRINVVTKLFSEDFLKVLTAQSSDKIAAVENVSSGKNEYFTQVPYGNSVVGVRFSEDGEEPLFFEFTEDVISGNISFKSFETVVESK